MTQAPITLYIDADACPVKDEAYKVAARYQLKVFVVANAPIMVPRDPLIERVLVPQGPDVADDWIATRVTNRDIVVTQDIPLAARCVKAGARVIGVNGKAFTPDSIGMALAMRDLMTGLRETGEQTRGPKPFAREDRSRFLSALDSAVVKLKRVASGE